MCMGWCPLLERISPVESGRLWARVALAVIVALVVAGCGGSHPTGSGQNSTSPRTKLNSVPARFRRQVQLGLRYAECIRAQGVPRFADPTISVSHDELIMQNPQMTPREIASPHATVVCAKYSPSSPEALAERGRHV